VIKGFTKKRTLIHLVLFLTLFLVPIFVVNAAAPKDFTELVKFTINGIISPLIFLAGSLAFLAFFWGIAVYIFKAGDEKEKERGKNIMFYGVIALFVMVAVWGLIGILKNTFFEGAIEPPGAGSFADWDTGGPIGGGGSGGSPIGGGGSGGGSGGGGSSGGGGGGGSVYDNGGCHCLALGAVIPCPFGNRVFGLPLPPGVEKKCPGDPGYIYN